MSMITLKKLKNTEFLSLYGKLLFAMELDEQEKVLG